MGSWRFLALGVAFLAPVAVFGASQTTPWLVIPPLVAAAVVLLVAAVAVDYFGVARRRHGWAGVGANPRRAWRRARALERRFGRQKSRGSPHTAWTARSLLVALAECDRLDEAAAVVDFLGADALHGRVGADATADALRAVALAEVGQIDRAAELCRGLEQSPRRRRLPVVAFASARVAALSGRPNQALARIEDALGRPMPGTARRDLLILRARALVELARSHEAVEVLAELAEDGWRHEVEELADHARARGNAGLALAARTALRRAAPYR